MVCTKFESPKDLRGRAPWKRVFSSLSYLAPYDDRETEKGSLFDCNAAQKHTSKGIVLAIPWDCITRNEVWWDVSMMQWRFRKRWRKQHHSNSEQNHIATITFHYRIWERMEIVASKVHINKNVCLHLACINTTNQKRIKTSKKSYKMETHKIQVQISFYCSCLHHACLNITSQTS